MALAGALGRPRRLSTNPTVRRATPLIAIRLKPGIPSVAPVAGRMAGP